MIAATTFLQAQLQRELTFKSWPDGKSKTIFGSHIEKISGNEPSKVTNIGYKKTGQLIKDIEQRAIDEMWKYEDIARAVNDYRSIAKGGVLFLYINRVDMMQANAANYIIVVTDEEDYEMLFEEPKYKLPNLSPNERTWWNSFIFFLPVKPKGSFIKVTIIEGKSDTVIHRFKIEL